MLKKLFLVIAMIWLALSAHAQEKKPPSAEQVKKLAATYLDLAAQQAEISKAGQACYFSPEITQGIVLDSLVSAVMVDISMRAAIKANPLFAEALGRNLGYYGVVGDFNAWSGEGVEKVLGKTTFWGQGSGVVANKSRLEFAEDGTLKLIHAEGTREGDNAESPRELAGTWRVSVGRYNARVSITIGGATVVYDILPEGAEFKLTRSGSGDTELPPDFWGSPAECDG